MNDEIEKHQICSVKIGSTYSVSAMRGGLETPLTKVIKSCVSTVEGAVSGSEDEVGVERQGSLFPLDKGIIESDTLIAPTEAIINKLGVPKRAWVVAAIPCNEIENGRERLKTALINALNPAKMILLAEVYCGAINALGYTEVNGMRKLRALNSDFIALNLGSTTLEILITLHGEKAYMNAFTNVCGNAVDQDLYDTLHNTLGKVIITIPEVKAIKEQFNMIAPKEVAFKVMTKNSGIEMVRTTKPMMKVLNAYIDDVASLLINILKNTLPSEVIAQVLDTPIVLTGGMQNIPGLAERLERELRYRLGYDKLSVMKQVDGHLAPAIGALTLANEIKWYDSSVKSYD